MRTLFRILFVLALAMGMQAQVPNPQIPVFGTLGAGTNAPLLNGGSFAIPTDANYTLGWPNTSCISCTITSTVSLTATRNVVMPPGYFIINACNYTSGGQSIQIIGSTGTGAAIPNGTCSWAKWDGTNWVLSGGSGGGGATFPATSAVVVNTSTTASRNALAADIASLWIGTGCSTSTNFPQLNGNCSASTATPGGSNTQVQINVTGGFGTDSGFTYNVPTHVLSIPGQFIQSSTNVPVYGGNFYGNSSFYTENRSAYTMLHTSGVGSLVPTTAGSNPGQDFHGLGQLLSSEALSIGESTQIARNISFTSLTSGQNLMDTGTMTCATTGDCIPEELQMIDYGGCGQPSEECFHTNWLSLASATSAGPCLSGCSANSTAINVGNATAKMGQGLILYDASVSSSINITGNTTIGGLPWYVLSVSGLTHGVSTYYQVTNAVTVLLDPGTNRSFVPPAVSIAISASPSYTGAASSTASVASSGYGCLANPPGTPGYEEYEYVPYTTVDGTHFNIYPWHDHAANAIFAIGGDCGYGLAQHATTTVQGSPVVVPIIATIDSTHVIPAFSNEGYLLGKGGQHGYQNASCVPTVVSRSEVGSTWYNFITVPTCGTAQGLWTGGLNLATVTIAGIVVDTTFNAASTQLTGTATAGVYSYATSATNVVAPTSLSAGTVTAGDLTATMYPVSQVVVPNDPASSNSVDGWILTSPWIALNAGDTVSTSLPAYSNPNGDLRTIETTEDPLQGPAGYQATFQLGGSRDAAGSGTTGFYALNLGSSSNYMGFGGVYSPPAYAFRVKGFFQTGLYMDAPLAGDVNTTAAVYVNSSDLNNIPGLPCYSYAAFQDSYGPRISVANCLNGGDVASQSITMDAPDVHLGTTAAGFWINRGDPSAGAIGTYLYGAVPATCSFGLALDSTGKIVETSCGGGSGAFSALTSGTNTTAAMTVGTGASFGYSGTGTVNANELFGVTISGTPSAGQVLEATSPTAANFQTLITASPQYDLPYFLNSGTANVLTGIGFNGVTCLSTSAAPHACTPADIANALVDAGTTTALTFQYNGSSVPTPTSVQQVLDINSAAQISIHGTDGYDLPVCGYDGTHSRNCPTASAPAFSAITSATNTTAAMVCGTGCSLATSGSGTNAATSLSAASALPSGTTATTQTVGDNTTKVATDAFVLANAAAGAVASVSNADGSIAVSSPTGAVVVSAPNVNSGTGNPGYMLSGGITSPMGLTISSVAPPSANAVFACQFVQPYTMTINHVTGFVGATASSGNSFNIGIYSGATPTASTLLLDSAAMSTTTASTAVRNTLGSSVTLVKGQVYWFAWGASSTTPTIGELAIPANLLAMISNNGTSGTYCVKGSNTLGGSAGSTTLPSSLGSTSAYSAGLTGMAAAFFTY